jgi:hypothetical protein
MKQTNYLEIGGEKYYVNLEAIDTAIILKAIKSDKVNKNDDVIIETTYSTSLDETGEEIGSEIVTNEYPRGLEINGALFEILRTMLEVILQYGEEFDDTLGVERAFDKLPFNFKIAFNTLSKYAIIQKL